MNKNQETIEKSFNNLAAVLKYLKNQGWKITRSSLYRHQKEGKLLPGTNGTYLQRAVDKYAKTFLKVASTGKRQREATDELQRQKLEEELKNLRMKNERDKFNFEKDQGLYVPKNQMEIELATRAGVLIAGLKHWVQTCVADWIAAVSGDTKKTGELINLMNSNLDDHINQYASNREYEVVIDSEDEPHYIPSEVSTADSTNQTIF